MSGTVGSIVDIQARNVWLATVNADLEKQLCKRKKTENTEILFKWVKYAKDKIIRCVVNLWSHVTAINDNQIPKCENGHLLDILYTGSIYVYRDYAQLKRLLENLYTEDAIQDLFTECIINKDNRTYSITCLTRNVFNLIPAPTTTRPIPSNDFPDVDLIDFVCDHNTNNTGYFYRNYSQLENIIKAFSQRTPGISIGISGDPETIGLDILFQKNQEIMALRNEDNTGHIAQILVYQNKIAKMAGDVTRLQKELTDQEARYETKIAQIHIEHKKEYSRLMAKSIDMDLQNKLIDLTVEIVSARDELKKIETKYRNQQEKNRELNDTIRKQNAQIAALSGV